MSDSLQTHGLYSPWNSPGQNKEWVAFSSPGDLPNPGIKPRSPKNTGVGSLSLLQGIFLTHESNWGLLHCRQILYQLSYHGSPKYIYIYIYIDGSPPGFGPWDSPGKNTGVGCHFLLQCMKVKSESEVAQSCSTLRDHMDCSLPGSSVHGIFQA